MKTVFILLLCGFLFLSGPVFSQVTRSEREIKRANDILYENPNESIKIGFALLKNEKNTDKVANLYLMISNAYVAKRDIDSSLYFIMKTTDLINSEALIKTKIRILNSVAVQYQQMQLYDKSLETLDKARGIYEKLAPGDRGRNYNFQFNNMIRGMIYRSQGNPEMALEKFAQAAEYFKKLKQTKGTCSNVSIILYNMGYCYLELNRSSQAKAYFSDAVQYGQLAAAKSIEAYALKGLAENLYVDKNYTASLALLNQAQVLAKPVGDLVLNEGIYQLMADNYLAVNQWESYQFYRNAVAKLKQEKEKKEQQSLSRYINIQTAENLEKIRNSNSKFNLQRLLIVGIALLCVVLLGKNFLSVKKRNRLLQHKIDHLTDTGSYNL